MSDLKPCPFCGGEAELTTFGFSWEPLAYGVQCIADAERGFDAHGHQIAGFGSAEKAIAAWNTRATHGTLTAEQVCKAVYAHSIHADCTDADWQAIADELNSRAKPPCEGGYCPLCGAAERTCKCTTDDSAWCFVCSECGKSFPRNKLHLAHNHGEINYCPNCGRRCI